MRRSTTSRDYLRLDDQPCDSQAWLVRMQFAEAEPRIRRALEAFGYYESTIEKSLAFEAECWRATFTIDAGEPVRYGRVDVRVDGAGADQAPWRQIVDSNPLISGQALNHADYEAYKKRFADLATGRGYFDGDFSRSRIDVNPAEKRADVELVFDTGERFSFGPVDIDQDAVDRELIERYIEFERGDPYDASVIARMYNTLLVTGYFDVVDIRTQPRPGPEPDVEVTIRASPSKPRNYSAGVGFGTDTGPKLRAGFFNRRLNTRGHQTGLSTNVSTVTSDIGVVYRIPLEQPRAEWLSLDAGFQYEDTDTRISRLTKAGVKRLQLRGRDWLETQFIDVSYEDYELADGDGTSVLIIPGISWTRVATTGPPRPLRGFRVTFQTSGTVEQIGSDIRFLQAVAYAKLIRPLWGRTRILARIDAGTTATSDFSEMPASLRFFAGGDVSVRGYEFETLGPTDADGNVVGGRHLLSGSIEVDVPVADKWSLAAFVDAGNAFDDVDDINAQVGVGVGARWFSPVGPIRVDVAVPLSDQERDGLPVSHYREPGPVMAAVRYILVGVAALLATILLAIAIAASHPAGFAWLAEHGTRFVPGELRISKAGGDLLTGVSAESLSYELAPLTVSAQDLHLRLRLPVLIAGVIDIRELRASRVAISIAPSGESDGGLPDVDLPLQLQVRGARIDELRFAGFGVDERLDSLNIAGVMRGARLRIDRLETAVRDVRIGLHGEVRFAGAWPLEVAVDWRLPGDPELAGAGKADGDLGRLRFEHELRLPQPVDMQGTVTGLLDSPRIDGRASWSRIEWPLGEQRALVASDGAITVAGWLDAYRLGISGGFEVAGLPRIDAQADIAGDLDQLEITSLRADGIGGTATASGRVQLADRILEVVVDADDVDLSQLDPVVLGHVDADATITAGLPGRGRRSARSPGGNRRGSFGSRNRAIRLCRRAARCGRSRRPVGRQQGAFRRAHTAIFPTVASASTRPTSRASGRGWPAACAVRAG